MRRLFLGALLLTGCGTAAAATDAAYQQAVCTTSMQEILEYVRLLPETDASRQRAAAVYAELYAILCIPTLP